MRRLLAGLRAVARYSKAQRLAGDREGFPAALALVEDLGGNLPTHLRVRISLLRGFLNAALRNLEDSHEDFLLAYEEAPKITRYYSKTDMVYMRAYAARFENLVSAELKRSPRTPEPDYGEIDLSKVAEDLIRYFPLTGHPDWQEFKPS